MTEAKAEKVLYTAEVRIQDLDEVKTLLDKAQKDIAAKDKEIVALNRATAEYGAEIKALRDSIAKRDKKMASKPSFDVNGVLDLLKKIRASMGGQFGVDGWNEPADVYKLANKAIELLGSK